MRTHIAATIALAAGIAAGCATLTHGGARNAYVANAMREYRFPVACEKLWPDALRMLAQEGFSLVGTDRELAGQDKQGAITNFLNVGHATTLDDKGVYESETDWNSTRFRYQVRGAMAGKDGCFVNFVGIQEDRTNSTERRHRDYEKEFYLLSVVAPAEGARISAEADKAK
jgi:hypothetical protein